MRQEEIIVQRRQTIAFIAVDPVQIRFYRDLKKRNNRGGMDSAAGYPLYTNLQRMRFVRAKPRVESTTAGQTKRCYDRLIARHDADVRAGDEFEYQGEQWKVLKVLDRTYEIVADVELREQVSG